MFDMRDFTNELLASTAAAQSKRWEKEDGPSFTPKCFKCNRPLLVENNRDACIDCLATDAEVVNELYKDITASGITKNQARALAKRLLEKLEEVA